MRRYITWLAMSAGLSALLGTTTTAILGAITNSPVTPKDILVMTTTIWIVYATMAAVSRAMDRMISHGEQ